LVAWGLPGVLVSDAALLLTASAVLPVWLLAVRRQPLSSDDLADQGHARAAILLAIALAYVLIDAMVGRQKFAANLFLSAFAAADFIDSANESVSQGRGLVELLGALMMFLPFVLIDIARQASLPLRVALWSVGVLFVFYDAGISRGYLLIAVLAIALGTATRPRNVLWASALALAAFGAASLARGDFDDVAFSNPLFDAIAFPYINLGLMLAADCGAADWSAYVGEFAKKFMPAFLVAKDIFSFNIEMTRCIYPWFGDAVESISIFTWLGEVHYYQPGVASALAGGVLLAALCRLVDARLAMLNLWSTRVFCGLMCIVLLRSRIQDVLSFLVFLFVFLLLLHLVSRTRRGGSARSQPITPAGSAGGATDSAIPATSASKGGTGSA
jgi:hypothetical protein